MVYGGIMNTEPIVDRVMNYVFIKEEEAKKETARKYYSCITDAIIKYLGVTSVSEASKLSLIDSTLTYDIVLDAIGKLNKEFSVEVEE